MLQILPAGSPALALLTRLTSGNQNNITLYCTVPATDFDVLIDMVLWRLVGATVQVRAPPFHQDTCTHNVLNFSMIPLPDFRNHMYCRRILGTGQSQAAYGPTTLSLADTRG